LLYFSTGGFSILPSFFAMFLPRFPFWLQS
jgi:hypothetical protein